jgi:hypothetical protein
MGHLTDSKKLSKQHAMTAKTDDTNDAAVLAEMARAYADAHPEVRTDQVVIEKTTRLKEGLPF